MRLLTCAPSVGRAVEKYRLGAQSKESKPLKSPNTVFLPGGAANAGVFDRDKRDR